MADNSSLYQALGGSQPQAPAAPGSPGVAAAPQQSLYQGLGRSNNNAVIPQNAINILGGQRGAVNMNPENPNVIHDDGKRLDAYNQSQGLGGQSPSRMTKEQIADMIKQSQGY